MGLVGALGAWALGGADRLGPLWPVVQERAREFTGEELVVVVVAALRLGLHDDGLLRTLQERALFVGPWDAAGARNMMQCLEDYWHRWPCEGNRRLAASFA